MTTIATPHAGSSSTPSRAQPYLVAGALLVISVIAAAAGLHGWRQLSLALLGAMIGVTLYHSSFSFATAYRRFFVSRDTSGIEAHLLLLALSTIVFVPILAFGGPFGDKPTGAVAPIGTSVAIGAFLFGIGMQLGGGCGSGTLYTVGGGSSRMAFVLGAFCAGAFLGSLHLSFWQSLPEFEPVSLGLDLGWIVGPLLQLGVLVLLCAALRRIGRPDENHRPRPSSLFRGNWSLATGAFLLALLNAATLGVAGHPWVITWGFTLWGAKISTVLGWSPASSPFWSSGYAGHALMSSLFADTVSTMNMGILAGAFLAAALAGRFAISWRLPWRSVAAAVLGGLMMGYGARLSFGCNIGAFVSGVASTSLHGWQWIIFALPGTWIGVRMRPRFGLRN